MDDEGAHLQPWPWVLTDPLDDALDYSVHQRRRPALFPPLLEPKGGKGGKRRREEGPPTALQGERGEPLVENEPGLCTRMEASHAALLRAIGPGGVCCAAWRLTASGPTEPAGSTAAALLPPLAEPATAQRYARPLRRVEVSTSAVLRPPMLYSLVHNTAAHEVTGLGLGLRLGLGLGLGRHLVRAAPLAVSSPNPNPDPNPNEVTVEALGARWLLPPQSAFLLSDMARWRELPPLRPPGGYRLILADPPWHSASAQVPNPNPNPNTCSRYAYCG